MSVVPPMTARPSLKRVRVVGAAAEAEKEAVGAEVGDVGVVGEAELECGQVEGAMVFVDLDRVSAAKSDVRPALAGKVREDATGADGAAGERRRGRDFAPIEAGRGGGVPQIEGEEGAAKEGDAGR